MHSIPDYDERWRLLYRHIKITNYLLDFSLRLLKRVHQNPEL